MSDFFLQYRRPEPITWVYLASLLSIGLFFVFHRLWSVRNLDLLLLLALAPGLVLVQEGRRMQATYESTTAGEHPPQAIPPTLNARPDTVIPEQSLPHGQWFVSLRSNVSAALLTPGEARDLERTGFLCLLGVQALLLLRMLLDPTMVRRPLLEPNLSVGGLIFITTALLAFMCANVLQAVPVAGSKLGPGYSLMGLLPNLSTLPDLVQGAVSAASSTTYLALARGLAIASQVAIIVGLWLVGYRHFGNMHGGAGAAALYLLTPYTAQMFARVDHALPAALLVWAILLYRRPFLAGVFLSLAAGLVYYPLFLLPLWISFYWPRGLSRFVAGVVITLIALTVLLAIGGPGEFVDRLQKMYGLVRPVMDDQQLQGLWGLGWNPIWRLPLLVAFFLLSALFIFWPAQKNLGTLISCSGALMVAAQFWHGFSGGLYIAWFLPLLLLTIFRPNLEDRVALKVLVDPGLPRRVAEPSSAELGAA
jgi:hypothetical protein